MLRVVLNNVVVLSLLAIPIANNVTTSRISMLALVAVLFYLVLTTNKIKINNIVLLVPMVYLVLMVSLFAQLTSDQVFIFQFFSSLSLAILLFFISDLPGSSATYTPAVVVLFVSGFLYFPIMMYGPFLGVNRYDILIWQQDTSFFFGINRYLLALYVVNAILLFSSGVNPVIKNGFLLFYLAEAVFLGSRTHLLLSASAALLVLAQELRKGGYRHFAVMSLVAIMIYFSSEIYAVLEVNVIRRVMAGIASFDTSPRGIILNEFLECAKTSNVLYGNEIMQCVNRKVSDLDNTFLFVMASGGLLTLCLFSVMLFLLGFFIAKSKVTLAAKFYLMLSFMFLLSVDVMVSKTALFFPVVIYLLTNGEEKSSRNTLPPVLGARK